MQLVLYDLRKNQKKMTQEQMAKYLGITPKTYRSKELGNSEFTLDEMFEIAKLFNKKIDDIFLPRKYQSGTKSDERVKGG
ncbi:helix-turn-helix transcriptional regulator [Limosilactobacillus reuteri]|uniref:helix-turn-helix transcriptional regulator n=1 Tax=Limosilactobacillus reuteri TaxID=1598 RepID=UPI000A1EA701|nr:helix-turn-helix domain-containing protein [Limosilactobacillus reuteri]